MSSLIEVVKKYALVRAIVSLLMGVALILWPELFIQIIVYLIGAYVVIMGIMGLFSARKGGGSASVLGGVLMIALGVCMFLFYQAIASILPVFIGILFILLGVVQFFQGFRMRKYTGKVNVLQMLLGALVLAGGVVGILNPFGTLSLLFQVFGVVMLVSCVNEFGFYLNMRKIDKE